MASKLQLERYPDDKHVFSFSDTLYEDADCYRFLLEGLCYLLSVSSSWVPRAEAFPDYRVAETVPIESYSGNPAWRRFLADLRAEAMTRIPQFSWLVDGRDVWEVFRDVRFLGNSSVDPCSRVLKRELRDAWLKATFQNRSEVTVVVGIGPDERHRFEGGPQRKGFGPMMRAEGWNAAAPMLDCFEGEVGWPTYIEKAGIERPRLYKYGNIHNNCGGFCCKAGQAHFENRYYRQHERYLYDAMMERKLIAYLGANVSMLTDRSGDGKKKPLTLDEFAAELRQKPGTALKYMMKPGESGCGCAL